MKAKAEHKAEKGLVRISLVAQQLDQDTFQMTQLGITGDFFFHPEEKLALLEKTLQELILPSSTTQTRFETLEQTITAFYETEGIISPGLRPYDFAVAINKALIALTA